MTEHNTFAEMQCIEQWSVSLQAGGSEPPQSTDVEVEVDDNGLAHLTDDNFDAYLGENHGIHFVKFYAPW